MSEAQGQAKSPVEEAIRVGAKPLYDRGEAVLRFDGDASLFAEMAALYVAESDAYGAALAAALAAAKAGGATSAQALQREAHTMKSVFATFSCESGRLLALRLEQTAAAGRLEDVEALTEEVAAALAALAQALAAEALVPPT